MEIVLNGKPHDLNAPCTVARLLEELGLGQEQVAVELNRRILQRDQFAGTRLETGDRLEIVRFVGGG